MRDPPFLEWQRTANYLALIRTWDPPPPQPYIGERQALAPPVLPPSLEIVPNPPFLEWQRTANYLALTRTWDPPAPQPFIGSPQPLDPRTGPPSTLLVDTPPKWRFDLGSTLNWWIPPPPPQVLYDKVVQGTIIVTADNPPFGLEPWLNSTLAQWQVTQWPQQQGAKLIQAAAADNPPFGLRRYLDTLAQWQARPLTPIISGWQIYVPDNPPFGLESWLASVLAQWQIVSQPQQRNLRLIQAAIAAAADNPPFGMPPDWLWGTLGQWQITTPALIRYNKLAQAFVAAVDQPPPRTTLNFITTLKAWEPAVIQPQHNIYLPQPFVVVPTDNPPFGMPPDWLYTVLTATWKPGEPLPKVLQKILQAGAAPVIATGQKEKRKWRRSSS